MKWTLFSLWTVSVLLCFLESVVGQTQRNVTVDDQSSAITYAPSSTSWTLTEPGEWDAGDGRAHMLSQEADAVATFTFTGVAFYYWAAMWPYPVLTTVSIDGSSTLVNLTDPSPPPDAGLPPSRQSSILYSATNLANTTHTVRITVGPETGSFAIVDFFTYTVLETTPTTTTTPGGGGTATATKTGESSGASGSDASGVPSPSKGLSTAVKVGIAVAVIGFLLLLLVLFFILRWLKRRREEADKPMVAGFHSPDPNISGASGMGHANISLPMSQNSMWTDPDYVEANRRMNLPVAYPYQAGSRSSVRLVPPDPRLSDGTDYPSSSFMNPPPAPPVPSPGAQAVHDIYNYYSQPNPPPARPNPTYNYYNSSYGR